MNKHPAHEMVVTDFLKCLAEMGWPAVDSALLSSATITGVLGPGRENWEQFARYAPIAQLRHIRTMAEYNPSTPLNHAGGSKAGRSARTRPSTTHTSPGGPLPPLTANQA